VPDALDLRDGEEIQYEKPLSVKLSHFTLEDQVIGMRHLAVFNSLEIR
jgi:hypothetical protein